MLITEIIVDRFKNLRDIHIIPDEKYNIITGKNAQGKTNLLEAMWILSGCKSFRGSKERDYIAHNAKKMTCEIKFKDSMRNQNIKYELEKSGRKILVNGVGVRGTSSLFDIFKCIVFTPDDTELIKGSPEKRRNFTDMAASQYNPVAAGYVTKCCLALNQRNAVLKNINSGISDLSEIGVWDGQLSRTGTYVSLMRHNYIKEIGCICENLYSKITGGSEKLEISYRSNVYTESDFEASFSCCVTKYMKKLMENTESDLKLGYTCTGVGRDDISIRINGYNAREFGSQGQIKSAALVLKLAQAEICSKKRCEPPVIFLDDVMGELDESRQRMVFEIIKDMQVFITTCNESSVMPELKGKVIRIKEGIACE